MTPALACEQMPRLSYLLLPASVVLLLLTGCGDSAAPSASARAIGTLHGRLAISGGTLTSNPCGCHPEAGTVRLTSLDGYRVEVATKQSGKFSVTVPAGRYRIVAGLEVGWPMGSCHGLSGPAVHYDSKGLHGVVVVAAGQSRYVEVDCVAE